MNRGLIEYISNNIIKSSKATLLEQNNEVVLEVAPKSLIALLRNLRDDTNCLFTMLVAICGVDYPDRENRFSVIYCLLSMKLNYRIRVKVNIAEKEHLPTAEELYSSANWYEREIFDMYGIKFDGNSDLRRILTDYGFEYYPLRKDFPLTGYDEVRYDIEQKKVVYEPVKLDQEYRNFDYLSPWEGEKSAQILPGDEKAQSNEKKSG